MIDPNPNISVKLKKIRIQNNFNVTQQQSIFNQIPMYSCCVIVPDPIKLDIQYIYI